MLVTAGVIFGMRPVMRRRRYIVVGILLLAGALAFVLFSGPAEPSYDGRSLSEWLEYRDQLVSPHDGNCVMDGKCRPNDWLSYRNELFTDEISETEAQSQEAVFTNAIAHIGTKAIPFLVKCIQFEEKPWQTAILAFIEAKCPNWSITCEFQIWRARHNQHRLTASYALAALGSRAESAIPELVRWLDRPSYVFAADALAGIGEKSAPALVAALTNAAAYEQIVFSLEILGTNAHPAIPLLVQNLKSTNTPLAERSVMMLGNFEFYTLCLPGLEEAMHDPRPQVRRAAVSVLATIGPEAMPALRPALNDPEPDIRAKVSNLMEKIDLISGPDRTEF
jgi:hypothetical protein